MKDIKEIGKVIQINDYSETEDSVHVKVTRKIVMDDREYEILPLRCGDSIERTPDFNREKLVAKVKQDLLKHIEEHIEVNVFDDIAVNNQIWAKASLFILTGKNRS